MLVNNKDIPYRSLCIRIQQRVDDCIYHDISAQCYDGVADHIFDTLWTSVRTTLWASVTHDVNEIVRSRIEKETYVN